MSSPNSTRCGRRKSAYSCSVRKVVISNTSSPSPDGHGPEPVLVDRAREQLHDPLRQRVGREVPVRGLAAQERVAQRPADDERRVPARVQAIEEPGDGLRDGDGEARGRGVGIGHGGRQFRPRKR